MLNPDKNLKIYYSTGEVAAMFGLTETQLRFWETKFPQLKPKRAGRSIRQYTQEDIETVRFIHYLVKERGMTIQGAQKRLKDNPEYTHRNYEVVQRLKAIRAELVSMRDALDVFAYTQMDELRDNIRRGDASDEAGR